MNKSPFFQVPNSIDRIPLQSNANEDSSIATIYVMWAHIGNPKGIIKKLFTINNRNTIFTIPWTMTKICMSLNLLFQKFWVTLRNAPLIKKSRNILQNPNSPNGHVQPSQTSKTTPKKCKYHLLHPSMFFNLLQQSFLIANEKQQATIR